ncbi:MAG: toll/interleukin-1 receptor domain-containing protein, partial [Solobacterium sp.]|nr:toll/interleukin-1 receptor domain-containing protein [Solobacterium sp.]
DEAKTIDDIQKGILAISSKEEPFDIFICYKETDINGRRTMDSVLAQDLYNQLTKEGYKVFFSRITLEDKLGTAYEPYIFAALNSARVMVVVGTSKENFNAVWVKNEWSRYLALINQGQEKTLIPAYRDMDPYDLPDEFSYLQAQDMNKLGFMQDLLRGINKITGKDKVVQTVVSPAADAAQKKDALIKRMNLYIEDKQYSEALQCIDQILEVDPENYSAYLGKLLVALELTKKEDLATCGLMYENNPDYEKAVRFADPGSRQLLTRYAEQCRTSSTDKWMNQAGSLLGKGDRDSILKAKDIYLYLSKWNDVKDELSKCDQALVDIQLAEEKKEKKRKRNKLVAVAAVVLVIFAGGFFVYNQKVLQPARKYNEAIRIINEDSNYSGGIKMLGDLGDYKDSKTQILDTIEKLMDNSTAVFALDIFNTFLKCKDEPKYETVAKAYINKIVSYTVPLPSLDSIACQEFPDMIKERLYEYLNNFDYDEDDYRGGADRLKTKLSRFTKYLSDDSEMELLVKLLDWSTGDSVSEAEKRSLWKYQFIQEYLTDDDNIFDFMIGNWTTSDGMYFIVTSLDDGYVNVSYNLPTPAKPAGTEYINFRDKIFTFDDKNGNELAKVYKFTFTSYDKANVYCYSNNRTYTVTRQ